MTPTPPELSMRRLNESLNGRYLAVMDEFVAEDFEELDPAPGQGPGREGLKEIFALLHCAFSDMHWEADERNYEGNKVVTRFHWTGTHDGDFIGIPATGKQVRVRGVVIDEYRDAMLVRSRILSDDLGMFQQFGLILAPPGA